MISKTVNRRVKLYHLDEEGRWDDQGTGYVTCETEPVGKLFMKKEKEEDILLNHVISQEDIYQLQNESLIVWPDKETGIDMALSFQTSEGCQEVWDEMRLVQGREPDSKEIIAKERDLSSEDESDEIISAYKTNIELPSPEKKNLSDILNTLSLTTFKSKITSAVLKDDFILKLFDIFEECESEMEQHSLETLFNIFKIILFVDSLEIFSILFSEEHVMKFMGVLQYDPEVPSESRVDHRKFLNQVANYNEVVKFSDDFITQKIHQTFQIQYLKDGIFPRSLVDDPTNHTLGLLINQNYQTICVAITEDDIYLKELFDILRGSKNRKRKDAFKFLQELVNMLKSIQIYTRNEVYQYLIKFGFFEVLEEGFIDPDLEIRKSSANMIHICVNYDSTLLREFMLKEDEKCSFFKYTILGIINQNDTGVQEQISDILQIILEPDNLGMSKDVILNLFYDEYIQNLSSPFEKNLEPSINCYHLICDLFSFFVKNHGYRSKNFVLKNGIIKKILKLVFLNEKYLNLAAIRFFKSCICLGDIFYHNHIIQHDLFSEIFHLFSKNKKKFNLINSSILDIFEIIRKENSKKLINYLLEKYEIELEESSECEPIRGILSLRKTKKPKIETTTTKVENQEEIEDLYFNEEVKQDEIENDQDDEKDEFPEYLQINLKNNEDEDELEFIPETVKEETLSNTSITFKIDEQKQEESQTKHSSSPTIKRKQTPSDESSPNKKLKIDDESNE
eukprot:gene523-8036_t